MDKNKLKETGKDVTLSLQHMFAMLGATVLVPILGNMNISMALISAGIGTICFYLITKKKVPVFLGSSFAFLPAYILILASAGEIGSETWNQAMGGVSVALILTGLVSVLFAFIVKKIGVVKMKKIFPAIVIGPIIILIGMILAPKMFYSNIVSNYVNGNSAAWKEWSCAILTAVTIIVINCFTKPKSFLRVMPILIGFAVGYIYGLCIGLVNFEGAFSGNIVVFQEFKECFSFYGNLNFNLSTILAFLPVSLVCVMEHMGDIAANSTICGKDFMSDPGLDKTLTGDGIATMVAGLLGAPANTTYGENTAVLAMTKNYNPKNIFRAAIFALIFGVFTPFGEFLTTIPPAVIGGASIVLFGMISVSGLRALVDSRVDFSKTKNLMVVTIVLSVGLGLGALSLTGDITSNTAFKVMIGNVEISPLCIATLLAILLNLILPNTYDEQTNENTSKANNETKLDEINTLPEQEIVSKITNEETKKK